jgi:hypothetical protein
MENVMQCVDMESVIVCSKNTICQIVSQIMPDHHVEYVKNEKAIPMP